MRLNYGPHPSQWAELFVPTGDGPFPVVVVIHGGFWKEAYGAELGVPLAEDLAAAGVAAWNIEYRRVGSSQVAGGGGWPATCLDLAAAVDVLADLNQARVRSATGDGLLDLSRVVALGHSAGGQLAGWLAARSGFPEGSPGAAPRVALTGFVSQAGVLDLVAAAEDNLGGGAASAFLGGTPDSRPDAYRLASPLLQLPLGVPSICVHGAGDDTVPISQSEDFVAAASRAGDSAELVALPGVGHLELVDVRNSAWAACRAAVLRLLDFDPRWSTGCGQG